MARTRTRWTGAAKVAKTAAMLFALTIGGCIEDANVDNNDGRNPGGNPGGGGNQTPPAFVDADGRYIPGTFLLSTRWRAGAPANNMVPFLPDEGAGEEPNEDFDDAPPTTEEPDGQRAPIGCGAVSEAQILRYHEWPKITSVDLTGYRRGTLILPTIERNNFVYDWANMKNFYERDAQGDSADAIAVLMLHARYIARVGSSGVSQGWDLMRTRSQYFDYEPNIARTLRRRGQYVRNEHMPMDDSRLGVTPPMSQDSILTDIWEEIMRLQIDSLLPVKYSGGGHILILDGYDNEGRFHFNGGWGWVAANSWRDISLPRIGTIPNAHEHDFITQSAQVNIMPNLNGRGRPDVRIFGRDLRTDKTSLDNGEIFFVNPTIYNIGTATSPEGRSLGIALYTSEDDFVIIGETILDETQTFTRAREPVATPAMKREDFNLEIMCEIPSDIPAGDYVLRAVMKNDDDEWEVMGVVNNYKNDLAITVGGDGANLRVLRVENGTGGGFYEIGTVVNVAAPAVNDAGQYFFRWVTSAGTEPANSYSRETTVAIGTGRTIITAQYTAHKHALPGRIEADTAVLRAGLLVWNNTDHDLTGSRYVRIIEADTVQYGLYLVDVAQDGEYLLTYRLMTTSSTNGALYLVDETNGTALDTLIVPTHRTTHIRAVFGRTVNLKRGVATWRLVAPVGTDARIDWIGVDPAGSVPRTYPLVVSGQGGVGTGDYLPDTRVDISADSMNNNGRYFFRWTSDDVVPNNQFARNTFVTTTSNEATITANFAIGHVLPGRIEADTAAFWAGFSRTSHSTVIAAGATGERAAWIPSRDTTQHALYVVDVAEDGEYQLSYRIFAESNSAGTLYLIDAVSGERLDIIEIPTATPSVMQTIVGNTVNLNKGRGILRLEALPGTRANIDWIGVERVGAARFVGR